MIKIKIKFWMMCEVKVNEFSILHIERQVAVCVCVCVSDQYSKSNKGYRVQWRLRYGAWGLGEGNHSSV